MIIQKIWNKIFNVSKGAQRYSQLYDAIKENKAINIMEIGTWTGGRAVKMIGVAKQLNPQSQISYYGFDLFEDLSEYIYKQEISKKPPPQVEVEARLKETGADIHLYKGNTMETLPKAVDTLPQMDFVFIDGGHSLETIKNDWHYTEKTMDLNTIVIFDDYWPNRSDGGCKPIVDAIDREKFNVEILPIVDVFDNTDFGKLTIQFAKVSRKKA